MTLVVPFTHDLEGVSLEEAKTILTAGHPEIAVMAWSEMSPTDRALRINGRLPHEANYPLQNQWSLHHQPGYEAEAAQLALALNHHMAQATQAETAVWLTAVGDIMLDRSLGHALSRGDLAYPFADIISDLTPADITLGNVESALGNIGDPVLKSYPFRAPPEAAPALAQAGFDVVSLANNHGMDYGAEALRQGIELLQAEGIGTIGAGGNAEEARRPFITTIHDLTIAFLGYVHVPVESKGFDTETWTATESAAGIAWGYPETIAADVTAVRPQADIVVVVLHSGYEYRDDPSPPQVAGAKAAVDAGADLVIGHHAHILQGVEFYKEGVIVYGLGNFAFEIDGPPETAVLHVWLDKNGVRQLEFVPAVIQFGGQPRLATPPEAFAIRQRLYHLTNELNQ
ncbi:MAG: CapA family protein [Chloroflexota bacterium]